MVENQHVRIYNEHTKNFFMVVIFVQLALPSVSGVNSKVVRLCVQIQVFFVHLDIEEQEINQGCASEECDSYTNRKIKWFLISY